MGGRREYSRNSRRTFESGRGGKQMELGKIFKRQKITAMGK